MIEQTVISGRPRRSAGITAHELHNLISVIIAEAQLLQLDYSEDAPNYRSAVAIERAGRRLESLVDRLATRLDTVAPRLRNGEGAGAAPAEADRQPAIQEAEA